MITTGAAVVALESAVERERWLERYHPQYRALKGLLEEVLREPNDAIHTLSG